ncbi:peptidoglycan-binding domain-containing protein [Tessaracoccus palaemonis]|uniref:Peptidoglycan-binding protein n=1 Tax=Tessaracoccus palaemonis TaxID=2829499 RepID=A0ABX8SKT4_9ACTN|nr:peptidoglycan-binding domain-containing protein [Tessaracoccus palaemonis]QXT62763.1 peptidoglycan-binding protein [Tessaracoccus palaemonis]
MSSAATRTGTAAIAWAKAQSTKPSRSWHNLCLMFVRSCLGVSAHYLTARLAWLGAEHRHETTNAASIPAGVPVFWRTGTVNWHIAISAGDGYCWSSDIGGKGKVGKIGIDALSRAWNAELLGWTEDLNGVRVYSGKPIYATSLTRILANARDQQRPRPRSNDVIRLQRILRRLNYMAYDKHEHGRYGRVTRAAVAKAQRAQGYKGSAADGYLGTATLAWLEGKAAGTSLAFRAVR